jgi:CubicO group peptidase (beta-lactamase class C family)/D-alanyl-D-alanine dipeptidase
MKHQPALGRLFLVGLIVFPLLAEGQERFDYRPVIRILHELIQGEVMEKDLPSLSVAVVDDQAIVWAEGFGFVDVEKNIPADAKSIYRAGALSQTFTALASMQLVERNVLSLDDPLTKHLSTFIVKNFSTQAITLRHLLSHTSGLVREPPRGHCADTSSVTLAESVKSLASTSLVFEPGSREKFSNAGIAVAGRLVEVIAKQRFEDHIQESVLHPLGLDASFFGSPRSRGRGLTRGSLWTYDGRSIPLPVNLYGNAPASGLYSSAFDLGIFLTALFAGGEGTRGRVVQPVTLAQMWVPQLSSSDRRVGCGLGFVVEDFEGYWSIRQGGSGQGTSVELMALPEEKIGVVLLTSIDGADAVLKRLAKYILHLMLAYRQGNARPLFQPTFPLHPDDARALAGTYTNGQRTLYLTERRGKLSVSYGEFASVPLKLSGPVLVTDGRQDVGTEFGLLSNRLVYRTDTLTKTPPVRPAPPPAHWAELIGEYGWDHYAVIVHERDGKLTCLVDWLFLSALDEVSRDVFRFQLGTPYEGEQVAFRRTADKKVTEIVIGGVVYPRRIRWEKEDASFAITPTQPIDQLKEIAIKSKPPREEGHFKPPELVELTRLDPTIKTDVRYATTNNFMRTVFYPMARVYLQRPAAEALVRAHRRLRELGYGVMVFDGYRPWYVTKMFWDATPEEKKIFVADPQKGSRHNRGCAVDLTLYDLKKGHPVEMVSGYDEFSERAFPEYVGGTSLQRWHRELLRQTMEEEGFEVYEWEWWHFDYKDWRSYPIGNIPLEEIGRSSPNSHR